MKEIQKVVKETFESNFGKTPLKERLDDILRETLELIRYTDINHMKEETGDALSSMLMLCNESGWDAEELIKDTCTK